MSELRRRPDTKAQEPERSAPQKPQQGAEPSASILTFIVVSAISGMIFGFGLQKGRTFDPVVILDQLNFKSFVMMKMFLGAIATSMVIKAVLYAIPQTRKNVEKARASMNAKPHGLVTAAIGCFLSGVAMALSGSCPGTVMAQIGSGVPNTAILIFGGIVGSMVFGVLFPMPGKNKLIKMMKPDPKSATLDKIFGVNYTVLTLLMAFFLIAVIATLEVMFPDDFSGMIPEDYVKPTMSDGFVEYALSSFYYPAWFAGVLVGSVQFFLIIFLSKEMGSAGAYTPIFTYPTSFIFPKWINSNPFFKKNTTGIDVWQVVIYLVFAVVGANISSTFSGVPYTESGVGPVKAFAGGFFLLFGSRLCGGCTSGNGIAGVSSLGIKQIVAMISMFSGAFLAAYLL